MPSPIGHALGALAVGWIAGHRPTGVSATRQGLYLVGLGLAADLDLLVGRHSMETHSIGAACVAGAVAAMLRWPLARTAGRTFLAAAAVWLTHPVLDALATDTSAPLGVMFFWPFSREHEVFGAVFGPISRRWWVEGFLSGNLLAAAREVALLGPLAGLAWIIGRQRLRSPGSADGQG